MARIAMPVGEDFEDTEFSVPRDRLIEAGHRVTVLGRKAGAMITGKRGKAAAKIELAGARADPDTFDALGIPGGYSPHHLRLDDGIVSFVRRFAHSGKLVAAVCHGPQLLIEADAVAGRMLTSWPSVETDLENASVIWIDREVVEDGNLITSRKPDDLDAFCTAILRRLEAKREATGS